MQERGKIMKNKIKTISTLAVVLALLTALLVPVTAVAKNNTAVLDKYKMVKHSPSATYLTSEDGPYASFDGVQIGDTMQEARKKLKKDFDISHETRRDDGWDIGIDRHNPDYYVMVSYYEGKVSVISYQLNQVYTLDSASID